MASTAKGGMEPAIIPNKKHQVASILAPPLHIEISLKRICTSDSWCRSCYLSCDRVPMICFWVPPLRSIRVYQRSSCLKGAASAREQDHRGQVGRRRTNPRAGRLKGAGRRHPGEVRRAERRRSAWRQRMRRQCAPRDCANLVVERLWVLSFG
jgi:hypothetical protein